jgi:arylsulfatase A-like enzyme
METVDDEFLAAAQGFINKAHQEKKPFFVWFNPSRMHFFTHIRPEHKGISGPNGNFYSDGMVEHDNQVGALLKQLEDLGIAKNTIVIYTTDNGPHYNEWPDGAITPFRGEKNSNWEGAYRVPAAVRWPGHIPSGAVTIGIAAHQDWFPTLLNAAGDPDVKEKLLKGTEIDGKKYHVRIDGYNLLPLITGQTKESPRRLFVYPTDAGEICGIRYDDWKLVYMEQRAKNFDIWRDPFVTLRAPKLFNLRRDPFERADTDSNNYDHWWVERIGNLWPGAAVATKFFETFKEFPPRQKPEKWNLTEVMERIQAKPVGD